ncbi:MAG: tetratricopeptide repeat protein [Deltaproteobacteria bacterium]|nr:tetratricopeptide repeat protein [Deltaproteobacteria bacterium]
MTVVHLVLAMSVWGRVAAPDVPPDPVPTDPGATSPVDGESQRLSEASAAFTLGVRAYKEERYQDAREHFEHAQRLEPHSDTLFNLGLVQQAVDDHVAAWHSFDALLSDAADEVEREDILAAQAVSRAHVVMLEVLVSDASVICLDGRTMPRVADRPSVVTTPGEHQLDVDHQRRQLQLEGGQTRTVELIVAAPAPPPLPRRRLRALAVLGIISGGAAAGLGLSAGLVQPPVARLGLGVGAAVMGVGALTNAATALVITRRSRRWTPPPAPTHCPIDG